MREHVHVERNAVLKLGQLEKRFHQQFGIDRAVLRLQNDADVFSRLVANIVEQWQLLGQKQLCNLLDQARLLNLIWDLGDNNHPGSAIALFLFPARACAERTTPGAIGFENVGMLFHQNAAGREIGTTHLALQKCCRIGFRFLLQLFPLFRRSDEFFNSRFGMIDEIERRRAQLRHIMRRNIGGHADRDASRAIGKQIRECTRKDDGFLVLFIIGRAEVDGVFGNAFKKQRRDLGHTRFGITHRSRIIAVDVAEVALPVHERITHGKILRQTHKRVVNRGVAVWVEFTHNVADDTRTFCIGLIGIESQQAHCMHDAAMNRLQTVAHIRQRTMHDRGQRISEVAFLEGRFKINPFDVFVAVVRRNQTFTHSSQYQLRDSSASGDENQSSTFVAMLPSFSFYTGIVVVFSTTYT